MRSNRSGETKTLLETPGAGIINRIWITINDRSAEMLRSLRLRCYWDGESKPAVDVPLGDFFCFTAGRTVPFESEFFSSPEGRSFNCYIPMPFRKGARIIFTNESGKKLDYVFFDIDFITLARHAKDMLYFHAYWNREKKGDKKKDFAFLPTIKGKGRFLGVSAAVIADSSYRHTWWGEGEVKMYIDGDSTQPTICGTGSEDYIGTAWSEGVFAHRFQGCLAADPQTMQYAFYRFHVPDPIYFYHDIRVTIQKIGGARRNIALALAKQGADLEPVSLDSDSGFIRLFDTPRNVSDPQFESAYVNFYRSDDYCATAYFYLDKPSDNLPPLAGVEKRIQ